MEIILVTNRDFIKHERKDGGFEFRNVGFASDDVIDSFAGSIGIKGSYIVQKEWNNWKQEIYTR